MTDQLDVNVMVAPGHVSHPRYPNSTGTAGAAIEIVRGLCALRGHVFWADALTITSPYAFRPEAMAASSQVTDSYPLALAVANGGRLVTFDKRLVTTAVPNGGDAVLTLGP